MMTAIMPDAAKTDFAEQLRLVNALLDSHCYPHAVKSVRLLETPISWVLLAGHFAYKVKKALDLEFLDYTTLAARQFYCEEEIRLNRRLAPQLYIDVIAIGGSHARPALGAQPPLEYAVRMHRFASAHLMDRMLAQGAITPQHIDTLAQLIAAFHKHLPATPPNVAYGSAALVCQSALQNFSQLHEWLPDTDSRNTLVTLRAATEAAFSACEQRLEERHLHGYIRECHGDLHLGNIVVADDTPIPFDGIEFNPALRWIDIINDAAFLFMDLLQHQQAALAYRYLNAYLETTGDYAGTGVLHFYCAYRATVRAKVHANRARQSGLPAADKLIATTQCHRYLSLAQRCLEKSTPALIITHGLPGSGKTTFARTAAERFQAIRISSDVERKRLFGLAPRDDSQLRLGASIYNAGATGRTYNTLHNIAGTLLRAGYRVIVDAAFLKYHERERFRQLAQQAAVPFVIATIHAGEESLRTRIVKRRANADDASEADISVLAVLGKAQEPLAPQETADTVEFSNDIDSGGLSNAVSNWDRLERRLLRLPN